MAIRTKTLEGTFSEFGKMFEHDGKEHDRIHIGFNAVSYKLGFMSRILVLNSATNNFDIIKGRKTWAHGHKISNLWTIKLKYSKEQWENLVKYSKTNELSFDILLRNWNGNNDGIGDCTSVFRKFLNLDFDGKSKIYNIDQGDMCGYNAINFQKAGIKVINASANGDVIVRVALLEAGFYQKYHYVVLDSDELSTGKEGKKEVK